MLGQGWPLIPTLGRQRQTDLKVSLVYIVSCKPSQFQNSQIFLPKLSNESIEFIKA